MDVLLDLLKAANSLSPLAIIGLLVGVLLLQTKFKATAETQLTSIADNHLHDLPRIANVIDRIADTLVRIEVQNATILAKLNGHDR